MTSYHQDFLRFAAQRGVSVKNASGQQLQQLMSDYTDTQLSQTKPSAVDVEAFAGIQTSGKVQLSLRNISETQDYLLVIGSSAGLTISKQLIVELNPDFVTPEMTAKVAYIQESLRNGVMQKLSPSILPFHFAGQLNEKEITFDQVSFAEAMFFATVTAEGTGEIITGIEEYSMIEGIEPLIYLNRQLNERASIVRQIEIISESASQRGEQIGDIFTPLNIVDTYTKAGNYKPIYTEYTGLVAFPRPKILSDKYGVTLRILKNTSMQLNIDIAEISRSTFTKIGNK